MASLTFTGSSNNKKIAGEDVILRSGVSISNIGPKFKSPDSGTGDFLPPLLRAAAGASLNPEGVNRWHVHAEFSKLLAPSPSQYALDTNDLPPIIIAGKMPRFHHSRECSSRSAMHRAAYGKNCVKSPSVQGWNTATKYACRYMLAIFTNRNSRGNRKYGTVGAGISVQKFRFDFTYLITAPNRGSPLENIMMFSVNWKA